VVALRLFRMSSIIEIMMVGVRLRVILGLSRWLVILCMIY